MARTRSPPIRSTTAPATKAAGTWTSAAMPTMRPISAFDTPALARATGNDAVNPWNPAWMAKTEKASRSIPASSASRQSAAGESRTSRSRAPPVGCIARRRPHLRGHVQVRGVQRVARRRAWGSVWVLAALVVLLSSLFPVGTQAATPLTFDPVADAQVNSGNANGNYGSLSTIRTRQGSGGTSDPIYRSYLTFDVAGLAGQTVTGVTLRLYVTDASSNGQAVYAVTDTTWSESGLTYA